MSSLASSLNLYVYTHILAVSLLTSSYSGRYDLGLSRTKLLEGSHDVGGDPETPRHRVNSTGEIRTKQSC
jgi:hypothetical protein